MRGRFCQLDDIPDLKNNKHMLGDLPTAHAYHGFEGAIRRSIRHASRYAFTTLYNRPLYH